MERVKIYQGVRSQAVRCRIQCGLVVIILGISVHAAASCVTELNKIVKAGHGRVLSPKGKLISGAEITVVSNSDENIFKTKSKHDGTFQLAVSPGKYKVDVWAEGYIKFVYFVDLRSRGEDGSFDVPLQSNSECHDIRITTGQDADVKDKCSSEVVLPNLIIQTAAIITGQVKDQTRAPFKNSEILLRKVSGSLVQPGELEAKTDADGYFSLDEAEAGEYRLLASPSRGFAQPEKLECYQRRGCTLEIFLKPNPTDLPYAGCPLR